MKFFGDSKKRTYLMDFDFEDFRKKSSVLVFIINKLACSLRDIGAGVCAAPR